MEKWRVPFHGHGRIIHRGENVLGSPVIIDQRNCGPRLSADRSRIYRTKSPFSFRISVHISAFRPKYFRGAIALLPLPSVANRRRPRHRVALSFPLVYPTRRDTLFRSPSLKPILLHTFPNFSTRRPTYSLARIWSIASYVRLQRGNEPCC